MNSVHGPLQQLVVDAWSEYASHSTTEYVVHPSIPILYFGDLSGYMASSVRVITAALNPSKAEFPDDDRLRRFALARGVDSEAHEVQYLSALSAYFSDQPYRRWFNSLVPILEGMDASFFPGHRNVALHTDICSPLATDPTWAGLSEPERTRLREAGLKIWHDLVEYLQPDLILLSVAKAHLDVIRFPTVRPAEPIYTVPRERPYVSTSRQLRLASGKVTRLVFGLAAQTPFGLISDQHKRNLGRAVLTVIQSE
jgi:hypothetical protein